MPFWWGKKKEAGTSAGEDKAGSSEDPNRQAPAGVRTAGSVDFGDGAPAAPSMTGICQPVGGPVEAVAACYWQLVPGKKGSPRYHIDF